MRTLLFAALSSALVACAASPADPNPQGGGVGGKGDDATESSCPEGLDDADKILAAIEGGGNCYVASGIAESCAYGSSLDVQFVAAATDVCGSGFDVMPADVRAIYESLLDRCGAKFAEEEGTLYRSATAFCQLEITHLMATLYPEADASEPTVQWSASCPVESGDATQVEEAISAAPYCGLAADTAEACAWGSGIDGSFISAASEVCNAAAEMTAEDAATRDRLFDLCGERFADEGGSLGRSMVGYCGLQVTVIFDSLYSPVE